MSFYTDDVENRAPSANDPYSGFNDYEHAYDLDNVYLDKEFMQAATRSSYGRHPTAARSGVAASSAVPVFNYGMTGSTLLASRGGGRTPQMMPRSSLGIQSRLGGTGKAAAAERARPMTAVRAAGYTSAGRKSTFEGVKTIDGTEKKEDGLSEKLRKQETSVNELLVESIMEYDAKNYKKALEKAKEAGRKERATVRFRGIHSLGEPNLDLTLTVLLNLAQQYIANNMLNEALHVYHAIVKNKSFPNAGRLKVNIGNIYFRKKDYPKAVKYFRMALDHVPKVQQRIRTRILNNIGVTLVRLGKYEDALSAFEDCLDAGGDYECALNLTLAAYCLDDAEKMREAFQRLVDIPLMIDDDIKDNAESDVLTMQLMKDDPLNAWERHRRQMAERTILVAAKIISHSIAASFTDGYAWCVETIKQSVYASLAVELEMNKAIDMLRQGELELAVEALTAFNNKESKVASAASNNLSIVSMLKGHDTLEEAVQYSEQALNLDRYNASALVNRGNMYYLTGDSKLAQQCYREALQIEASCVPAIYNLGLAAKDGGDLENAKKHFYKLNDILLNNVEVLIQLASIYELEDDTAQAIELYTQANNLAPTDPSILAKLANMYDAEGDKSQAFQCHYDSYRYFPPNIEVIKWLSNYYLTAQFAEKAVNYLEKAALMEPNNIEWQLLIASCHRRSGNFQKAMELYKLIHRRFPNNVECLKFLVQICKDLRMSEEHEYADKLRRLEKVTQLKIQRDTDSAHIKRHGSGNVLTHSLSGHQLYSRLSPANSRPVSSRNSLRNSPSTNSRNAINLTQQDGGIGFSARGRRDLNSVDLSYKDPLGPEPFRPMTGASRNTQNVVEIFDDDDIIEDDLLPD